MTDWHLHHAGARALMGHALAWGTDPRESERLGIAEIMDGWALRCSEDARSIGPVSLAAAVWGEPVGAARWEAAAVGLACPDKPQLGRSQPMDKRYNLAKALRSSLGPEPLTRRAATACASIASRMERPRPRGPRSMENWTAFAC